MRCWVILLEYFIFIPAAWYFLKVVNGRVTPWTLCVIINIPATMIVDNGHFQFNQVMHGLVLWGISCILNDQLALATFFMVLAISFKQMALYFAFPFGVYALTRLCDRHKGDIVKIGGSIIGLIAVFIATILAVWSPFIYSGGMATVNDIFYRIFPIRRAIFEGKVATFWCIVNHCGLNFLKVNNWDRVIQLRMTTLTTVVLCIPSLVMLAMKSSRRNFLHSQIAVCMAFFLFSMQVHEK